MFTLNLCRHCHIIRLSTLSLFALAFSRVPLHAQDPLELANVQPPPDIATVNFRERPNFPANPQRLRRTVTIDGKIESGEWDVFYAAKNAAADKGTFYCNWDEDYLYLAVKSPTGSLVFNIDTGGDGWLRSADNLEIVVGSVEEDKPVSVAVRLLDAANSKDTPVWKEDETGSKGLKIVAKMVGGEQTVEIAIPKGMGSLVPRNGANIGLRYEWLPPAEAAAYKPTAPFEPHLLVDAALVISRVKPIAGVNPRLSLSDTKCTVGQTLYATFELLNQTDKIMPLKAVTWQGLGSSADALNMSREVNVPPIPSLKSWKRGYKTVLPADLAPGSYALTVTATTADGEQAIGEAAFTVVEPLQVQMGSSPEPVAIVGQTKLAIDVDIFSAVSEGTRGDVELVNIPAGWELKGSKKRGWSVDRQDARRVSRFNFLLPSTTPAGEYPVEAAVTWHGRTWRVKQTVKVVRTDAQKPATPDKDKL